MLEPQKIKSEIKEKSEDVHSLFCGNCYSQWILSELGYYLDQSDNKIAAYCPACFFNEFLDITSYQLTDKQVEIFENGPKEVFSRPKHILKKSEHEDAFSGFRQKIRKEMADRTPIPKDIHQMGTDELRQEIEYMKRELEKRA
jgi:hypothetical protein